ncbi:flagellar protein FliT [Stutzerimonas kirkiae]|uniref:Flagellar protein FliT n=1 Tax=Stutzerimonas kirkiae TaxID=2211392 RepID=A0A4Q9RDI5_9GAMM|nr:flagellar protein FliT [Stutzerimonas kirkiae]TBU98260.1 flagellar protein FliT [Stutzerimonas kirkiae]TBV00934.1 flagellar protein FliT [Stutzerimonas kirkiae]TBV07759.1 flagellar protein FliT [Stutzerimonas kirkiae]TBV16284.1 flagellar protein FliT [Stutzerimonas kirkiae]
MNASVKRLQQTNGALRHALEQKDWTAIGALDLQCRQVVEEVMREPQRDDQLTREYLLQLQALYRELVSSCQAEQQRLAAELVQIKQSVHGAKVYQMFG